MKGKEEQISTTQDGRKESQLASKHNKCNCIKFTSKDRAFNIVF